MDDSHEIDAAGGQLKSFQARLTVIEHEQAIGPVRTGLPVSHVDCEATEASLLQEVQDFGQAIQAARVEITAVCPEKPVSQIPSATDKLDAIVMHTASATNAILEICEQLDDIAAASNVETAGQLRDAVARIYEACTFQDITGQQTRKIITILKVIDAKITHIVNVFDHASDDLSTFWPKSVGGRDMRGQPMRQSDIDVLLASLD
jgi:chemotaxis protein CheZ